MRYFKASTALVCAAALLLSSSALLGNCSLASYSETRSFRDALDGRSMEDAISGPVDKDTSSYGDRTSSTPGTGVGVGAGINSMTASSMGMQSTPASSMMLTIPANGNLQQQQVTNQQDNVEQQRTGSELERETTSSMMNPSPADNEQQQQLMDQKSARQRSSPIQNGRLSTVNPMMITTQSGAMRNSRQQLQQQPEEFPSTGSTKTASGGNSESGFGEDSVKPTTNSMATTRSQGYKNGGSRMNQKPMQMNLDGPTSEDEQQQQQDLRQNEPENDQQQQLPEKSYANGGDDQQVAAKQRAMAAMLMSMNNGMKYSRAQNSAPTMSPMMTGGYQQQGFGEKKVVSNMAQNMMNSLANKAAYMNGMQQKQQQQQQQQQRQLAPPMMVSVIPTSGAQPKSQMYGQQPMNRAMMNQMMNQAGMRGGMRRANQRKVEKKMSPSMVNAMLNKMLSMKQKEQEQAGATNGGSNYNDGAMKPTTMAMLMKSPAGAEMLANMVMPQMSGAMADMSPAKKEQYKRMMMAAIMQQANDNTNTRQQEQQQQLDDSYGQQQQMSDNLGMKPATGKGASSSSRGYNNGATTNSMTTTMSPVTAMMMSMMAAKGANYDDSPTSMDQQQRMGLAPSMGPASNQYADRLNGKKGSGSRKPVMMSPGADFDQTQSQQPEQQQQSMDNGYSNGDQQREMPTTTTGGQQQMATKSSGARSTGRPSNYGQNTVMPGMKMNSGTKSGMANRYAEQKRQQQQQQQMVMMDNSGFGGNNNDGSDNSVEQQQRELSTPTTMSTPANMLGSSKSGSDTNGYSSEGMDLMGGASPTGKPMNGFRQAYDQQQQQVRVDGPTSNTRGGPTTTPTTMGTKSQGDSYPSSTSMPRPMPMQQSFGGQQSDSGLDQTQQQRFQDEMYGGAAPMGMAEPFAFDYKIEDDYGNGQYRKEESDKNGVVRGSYGYTDVSGLYRHVEYIADENGFRANIKSNEPGLSSESASSQNNGAGGNGGNNNNNSDNNRSSPVGGSETGSRSEAGGADSQVMSPQSPTNMDSNNNMLNAANNNNSQQQLQQQLMMMMVPSQTELNENGEK